MGGSKEQRSRMGRLPGKVGGPAAAGVRARIVGGAQMCRVEAGAAPSVRQHGLAALGMQRWQRSCWKRSGRGMMEQSLQCISRRRSSPRVGRAKRPPRPERRRRRGNSCHNAHRALELPTQAACRAGDHPELKQANSVNMNEHTATKDIKY